MRYAALHLAIFAQMKWKWTWDWEAILAALGFIILMVLGVRAVFWVRRWGSSDDVPLSPREELAAHRRLLEQGLLTQEEFDRVRARLEPPGPPSPPS